MLSHVPGEVGTVVTVVESEDKPEDKHRLFTIHCSGHITY